MGRGAPLGHKFWAHLLMEHASQTTAPHVRHICFVPNIGGQLARPLMFSTFVCAVKQITRSSGGRSPLVSQGSGGRSPPVCRGSGGAAPRYCRGSGGAVSRYCRGSGGRSPPVLQRVRGAQPSAIPKLKSCMLVGFETPTK